MQIIVVCLPWQPGFQMSFNFLKVKGILCSKSLSSLFLIVTTVQQGNFPLEINCTTGFWVFWFLNKDAAVGEMTCVSGQWYFTEATKAIASVAPCHCLGALEMLYSRNVQFPHRAPFTKENTPWCPCPFKNEAYRPGLCSVVRVIYNSSLILHGGNGGDCLNAPCLVITCLYLSALEMPFRGNLQFPHSAKDLF